MFPLHLLNLSQVSPYVFDNETVSVSDGKIESSPDDNLIELEIFDPKILQIKGEMADCQSKLVKENATLEEIENIMSSNCEIVASMDSKMISLLENGDITGAQSVHSQRSLFHLRHLLN